MSKNLKLPWKKDGMEVRAVEGEELIAYAGETEDSYAIAEERAAFITEAGNSHHALLRELQQCNSMVTVLMRNMTKEQIAKASKQLPAQPAESQFNFLASLEQVRATSVS